MNEGAGQDNTTSRIRKSGTMGKHAISPASKGQSMVPNVVVGLVAGAAGTVALDIVGYLDAFLVLFGLYLFVVLVILPGNPHENRYGAIPRPD